MQSIDRPFASVRAAVRCALLGTGLLLPAYSAMAADTGQEIEEVIVTGFRGSLNTALAEKRNETAAIDVIAAEDIGKFPDSNLAESMQRIPGVALTRGDGGEGRNISVRGLGPGFTKVRINGMEGAAQTGSSDIYGAGNNGRSFDFNVFPTEIFSQLAVRKTPSADVEEGSLGATVDLKAPSAFDYSQDQVFSITGRGIYNEVAKDVDPRISLLASKKFFDETFGVLATFSYQERNLREVGYSAVDILHMGTNGNNIGTAAAPVNLPFCTPIGWTLTGPSPAIGQRGATATDCSTGNPRTSDMAAFLAVYNRTNPQIRDAAGNLVPGGGAFTPRLPRYVNSEQDTERAGGSLSLQWRPGEDTTVSIDGLYSRYQQERRDNYILGLSLGRNISNNGQPMTSIRAAEFDEQGSLVYGLFDGMDVRSEGLVDQFVSTFKQLSLNVDHHFNEDFSVNFYVGRSINVWDGPLRFQTFIDAIDTDNFSVDFRGGRQTPIISFGFDVSDPNNFRYAPTPDGNQTVLGGFSLQGKPSQNITANNNFELSGTWRVSDAWKLKLGAQYRESHFSSHGSNPLRNATVTRALPAGVTIADITTQIKGLDDLFGSGAPASWAAVDIHKWDEIFDIDSIPVCNAACGAPQSKLFEDVKAGFAMFTFDSGDDWRIPIRGDFGVRYVKTDQFAAGIIPVSAPSTSIYTAFGKYNQVTTDYSDTLPSFNVVFELTDNLLARLSGSKVMSRAELGNLTPTAGVTATTRTGNVNNPFLKPIRAKTADLALEWYFSEGSLLSVAYFYKDIESFIQRITSQVPYRDLGLPDSLLDGTPSSPTDIFTVGRLENTPGGPLKGYEVNAQVQFNFLPGVWSHFGVLANYTRAQAEIEYILSSTNGVPTATTTEDLVGLSPHSASGTLFFENDRFSARATASYRDRFFRALPASPGSDVRGDLSSTFVDASASWFVTDNLTIILEAQNLTGERNTLYIDNDREDTLFQTEIGTTYTLGATFKF
ncbi:MAG TPA: TonB-dependent receptor [Steroidobacteraceae bacterium]|nr:TonB-dependent receptor [Steroidobacteraceae bacterium]